MEPDILAKASERTSGVPEGDPALHSTRSPSVESMSPPATTSRRVEPVPMTPGMNGHAHNHANGHAPGAFHRNGALNGHMNGHARAIAATVPAPATAETRRGTAREDGIYVRFGKRLLDVTGALVALVVTSPVLAIAAVLIKLESRGPVIYRSTRVGRGGRPFTFFKLRSMVNDADQMRHHLAHLNECDGPVFKISRDPRVTRIGRFLRSTSIDEIPQFVNVLRGEMSLVGPRPPIPVEVASYEPWQMHRLDVAPGITCLWQISGRSRIGFQEWMRLDLEYIRNRSFTMDLKILLRTIPAVLSREGAY